MRVLSKRSAAKLVLITRRFYDRTRPHFHRLGSWRRLSNNDLWIRTVYQVAVVGSSASMERLRRSAPAQRSLRFDRLRRLARQERAKQVHHVLRVSGVRYVPRHLSKCHKTRAVLANLEFL